MGWRGNVFKCRFAPRLRSGRSRGTSAAYAFWTSFSPMRANGGILLGRAYDPRSEGTEDEDRQASPLLPIGLVQVGAEG